MYCMLFIIRITESNPNAKQHEINYENYGKLFRNMQLLSCTNMQTMFNKVFKFKSFKLKKVLNKNFKT